ncbi:hypothetical protein [Natronobiforma cellulositropha]|uniref:hypothetical protein n=1 Tax=Natronobiforma cellulositropha TaxID=1679076 RepID=UPI0021D60455|nr:hypothetical protein [Natronobiforma cellulositropha]
MLESILLGTLLVHVAAGVVALLSGLVALLTRKGGQRHATGGTYYVYAMAVVVVTALPLALVDANLFLFTIAIFSGYLVFTGYRVLSRKRPEPGVAAYRDWAGHLLMLVAGVGMIGYGGWGWLSGSAIAPALIVFGIIGVTISVTNVREILEPPADRMTWFYRHLGLMGGGYIATVTAAITVNLTVVPPLARWLAPTLIGVPLIAYTVRSYERQFEGGTRDAVTGN